MKYINDLEAENIFKDKDDFSKEVDMCNYLEDNIKLFCKDVLGVEYISHKRESYLDKNNRRLSPNKPHVDFLIETSNKEYIIVECKNPISVYREDMLSIGQVLDYIRIAENNGYKIKQAYICTSRFKKEMCELIKRFNLPIGVCLLNKNYNAIWKGDD